MQCDAGTNLDADPQRQPRRFPPTTVTAIPPIITLTPFPPGCIDLLQNGGFETRLVAMDRAEQSDHAADRDDTGVQRRLALQLRLADAKREQLLLGAPVGYRPLVAPTRRSCSFGRIRGPNLLTGDDRQQVVLLAPGDTVMAVPWKVLENTRTWLPHSFDLIGVAGQTFAVYFNVINDGKGGSTAMFVDDAHLWACTNGAFPPPMAVRWRPPSSWQPLSAPPHGPLIPLVAADPLRVR